MVEEFEVVGLVSVIFVGDYLFCLVGISALPEDHSGVGQKRTDSVAFWAEGHGQNSDVFFHLFAFIWGNLLLCLEVFIVDVNGRGKSANGYDALLISRVVKLRNSFLLIQFFVLLGQIFADLRDFLCYFIEDQRRLQIDISDAMIIG